MLDDVEMNAKLADFGFRHTLGIGITSSLQEQVLKGVMGDNPGHPTNAAIMYVYLAVGNVALQSTDSIRSATPEEPIRNMDRINTQGTVRTDKTILSTMGDMKEQKRQ